MDDDRARLPQHKGTSWGAMTPEMLEAAFPMTPAWRDAVKRAWWRDGGSEEDFARLFPKLVDPPEGSSG